MRTRSQASAENSVIGKRRKGDDCVALEDGNRRKRRRVLSPREASYKELSRHSSDAEGDCFPCAKKSSLGKRNKGVESAQGDGASNKQAHEALDQEMIRCSPKIAEVPACSAMVVKTSTAETSKSINQRDGSDTAIELGPAPAQNHFIEQCSSSFERNFVTDGTSVQEYLHEQGRATCEEPTRHFEIVGTAVLPPKLPDTHCQSEKGNSNEGSPTLTRKGAEKRSYTASMKRKHTHLQSHSASRRKQSKNPRRAKKTVPMPIKSKKPSLKGIRAAKLRWTHLMQSIINAKSFPGCTSVDNKLPHNGVEQTMTVEEYPSNETRSLHKRRKRLEHGSLSTAQKRPKISKQQQKVGKQLRSLMRWIKTWLIQAKFSQITPYVKISKEDCPNSKEATNDMQSVPYASACALLMYAMVATRPDIAHAVGVVSRFMADLGRLHWDAVKSIMRYLKGTKNKCLCYGKGPLELKGFCDSDMARDVDTRKSTSGYVFTLAGGAVSWCSRLQKIVVLSTTEAEYISAIEASKEAIWLARLCSEFGLPDKAPMLGCDSHSAICLAKNAMFHARTKHIAVRYHFIREVLEDGLITLVKSTNGQNGNDMGEAFIMTEDERNAFANTMAKSCRQNEKLRILFLESVRILTMSGLMHATASTMLQEETCEEAHMLMDAWAEAKVHDDVARPLPMNLLKAMNQINCSGLLPNVVIHYLQVSEFTQPVS
ncbi:hypothetical protein L7F22_042790 [Adiantum nelumboides]|nr:hypothetical protein [Adiantum nelumboides]